MLGLDSLNITGTGKLDLASNALILKSGGAAGLGTWKGSAYTGLTGYIASGRNGGNWTGAGIVTTSATPGSSLTTLGIALASDVAGITGTQTASFEGQTVTANDVLVMYTYGGDANLDGKINIDDYGRIDSNVGQSGSAFGWFNGDFNYDGKINIDDYGIIDGNIGRQGAPLASVAGGAAWNGIGAVPEPASVSLFTLAGAGLLRCRRRRN